jgi:hypothetical protein
MATVYVLTTGGAIEKVYSENSGSISNTENKLDRYLRLLRLPDIEVNIVPLMNKDTLEMTEQDRVLILGMVRAILRENAPIVITHGTDTMVQTGLCQPRHNNDATVGTQLPISLIKLSHAWRNSVHTSPVKLATCPLAKVVASGGETRCVQHQSFASQLPAGG